MKRIALVFIILVVLFVAACAKQPATDTQQNQQNQQQNQPTAGDTTLGNVTAVSDESDLNTTAPSDAEGALGNW